MKVYAWNSEKNETLMNERGIDLKPILRGPEEEKERMLGEALCAAMSQKPDRSGMITGVGMHSLGG